jgi:hypothetical protein
MSYGIVFMNTVVTSGPVCVHACAEISCNETCQCTKLTFSTSLRQLAFVNCTKTVDAALLRGHLHTAIALMSSLAALLVLLVAAVVAIVMVLLTWLIQHLLADIGTCQVRAGRTSTT